MTKKTGLFYVNIDLDLITLNLESTLTAFQNNNSCLSSKFWV